MFVFIQTFNVPAARVDAFRHGFGMQDNGVSRMPGFLGAEALERVTEEGGLVVRTIARWRTLAELDAARRQASGAVDIDAFLEAHDASLEVEVFTPRVAVERDGR